MSTVTWIIIAVALAAAAQFFTNKSARKDPEWKRKAHYVGGVQYPTEEEQQRADEEQQLMDEEEEMQAWDDEDEEEE